MQDSGLSRPGLFARKSTGLVREVGRFEAIYLSLFYICIPLGLLVFTLAPFLWPGVNMALGYAITTAVVAVTVVMYSFLVAAMPRSGGDYVFISRSVHPILGCLFAFTAILMSGVFAGIFANWVTTTGAVPMLLNLGTITDNQSLVDAAGTLSGRTWVYVIGLVMIALCSALVLRGWKIIIPVMRILLVFVVITIVVTVVLMATTSKAEFAASFSQFASYEKVISDAGASGFAVGAHSSLAKLLPFIALAWTVLFAFFLPGLLGGELKSPKWTPMIGMMGSMLITGVLLTIVGYLCYSTFGPDFLGSMTYLYTVQPDLYPSLPAPMFFLYAMMLTGSVPVLVFICIGFFLSIFTAMFSLWIGGTRILLAVSLDRILPGWLAEVHPRWHSPTRINGLITLFAVLALTFYVYGEPSFFGFIYSVAVAQGVYSLCTATSAILLPWRAKDVFEASPFREKVAGVPLVTLLGCFGAVLYAWVVYVMLSNPDLGANATKNLVPVIGILCVGPVIYLISRFINLRYYGININDSYRELPPE